MKVGMKIFLGIVLTVFSVAVVSPVSAITPHEAWTDVYPFLVGTEFETGCIVCHDVHGGTGLYNSYGQDVADERAVGADGDEAIMNVESLDSDADLYNNITEIVDLTLPGDALDHPDSSIIIILSEYNPARKKLVVRATSDFGKNADLELLDFGTMKWKKRDGYWQITVKALDIPPRFVTVCGVMEDCVSDVVQ